MNIVEVEQMDLKKVTRLEVIDSKGRSYSNWNCQKVILSSQDKGRTLKIFIDEKDSASKPRGKE